MDRQKINTLATKTGANYYTKHLDGYSHLVVMLYAVLSNLRSLREVCLGFAANATRMNHLGIDHMICRSTLSDANQRRKSSFFGSIYRSLNNRYSSFLSDSISKKVAWFTSSVRDIRAFKVENWSDFTQIVKEQD